MIFDKIFVWKDKNCHTKKLKNSKLKNLQIFKKISKIKKKSMHFQKISKIKKTLIIFKIFLKL